MVDGIWPDGLLLDARLQYYGNDSDALDFELYGGTEANGFLAWRPDAGAPWQECEAYEWQPGSLANGSGLFRVLDLKQGQYAFAKGDVSSNLESNPMETEANIWPNPARNELHITAKSSAKSMQIWNASGQLVSAVRHAQGLSEWQVNVRDWARGTYFVQLDQSPGQALVIE